MSKIMHMDTQFAGVTPELDLSEIIAQVMNASHPVGSYYWTSDSSFNPNNEWGGTWVKLDEGIVLTSAGTNYPVASDITKKSKDGGATTSSTGNTTLGTSEIPSHNHGERGISGYLDIRPNIFNSCGGSASWSYSGNTAANASTSGSGNVVRITYNATHTHDSVGGGGAHNHGSVSTMQPYKNAYCWHRTA